MTGLPDSATKNTGPPGNCGLQIHQTGFLGIFVLSLSDINMPHYSWYICNSKLTGNPVFHLANCTRVIKKKIKKKKPQGFPSWSQHFSTGYQELKLNILNFF